MTEKQTNCFWNGRNSANTPFVAINWCQSVRSIPNLSQKKLGLRTWDRNLNSQKSRTPPPKKKKKHFFFFLRGGGGRIYDMKKYWLHLLEYTNLRVEFLLLHGTVNLWVPPQKFQKKSSPTPEFSNFFLGPFGRSDVWNVIPESSQHLWQLKPSVATWQSSQEPSRTTYSLKNRLLR